MISITIALSSGQVVEAAMVGRDGVVGAGAALDGNFWRGEEGRIT